MATYRFDEFLLQPDERRLLRNGVTVSLPPRAFDVLVFLVEHAGSLVAKNEILGGVWRDTAVEEANLCVAISAIRRVIGHDAVVTVPKYGYRFAAELHRDSRADGSPAPALAATLASSAAPSIFSNSGLLLGLVVIAVSAAAFAFGRAARKPGATSGAFAEISGPRPYRLTISVEPEANPAWAANGRILFASTRHGNSEIYAASSDGTGVRRLTSHPAHDQDPTWSHDGRTIAFASDRGAKGLQIYLMDADGSHIRPLTALPRSCVQPAWSPDDTRIAFQRNDEPDVGQDIYTVGIDGSKLSRVTSHRMSDVSPDWAPEGRLIAFASNRDGGDFDIYVADADGRRTARRSHSRAIAPARHPTCT
jgi:DNA-binding winged helix-turn-helix (wHTH) protein